MLYEESEWIGKQLIEICNPESKVLNVGSSSLHFRTIEQPHIEKHIFSILKKNKIGVTHTDIKNTEGVDIVGDLTDLKFVEKLKVENYNCIICSNLLEHLEDKAPIVKSIYDILAEDGYAIITVPYNYPYHIDPIDTMYRPNIQQLIELFNNLEFVKGEIIKGRGHKKNGFYSNYWNHLKGEPKLFFIIIIRLFFPFYKFIVWKNTVVSFLKMFNQFSVTCIILRKTDFNHKDEISFTKSVRPCSA